MSTCLECKNRLILVCENCKQIIIDKLIIECDELLTIYKNKIRNLKKLHTDNNFCDCITSSDDESERIDYEEE